MLGQPSILQVGFMTSERQRAANQANAHHSTGPKTPEGKAAVRLNSLQHGIFARDIVLPEEDAEVFEDLRNQVRANLSPMGPLEEFLVDRVVNIMWRLRRLERAETALFYSRIHQLKAGQLETKMRSYESGISFDFLTEITDKAAHTKAIEALERERSEQDRDEVLIGRAIDADAKAGDAFAKVARYERGLERSLYRALDELSHLQDKRQNRHSPPILDAATLNTDGTE